MQWPNIPIESVPGEEFRPPHCPWPECRAHLDSRKARFHRHGVFVRQVDGKVIPRFRCLVCRRSCSQQSFACSYYLKRPELLLPVAAGLQAGSAHRQLARSLGCAPSTVTRLSARLGRHAILLSAILLEAVDKIGEPVVHDDFETFVYSQEFPVGLGTTVGQDSWWVYNLEYAPHRRGGKRTPRQRASKKVARPASGAYRRAFSRMLDLLIDRVPSGQRLEIHTDGHPGYRAALRRHRRAGRCRHHVSPNPERPYKGAPRSPEAFARDEAMFAVDLLHLIIRHTLAHHRRETIAFGRRPGAVLERAWLMVVWRNVVKLRWERRHGAVTPGMYLGVTDQPWSWERVFAQRLFPSRVSVPRPWMRVYRRQIQIPELGTTVPHRLVRAF